MKKLLQVLAVAATTPMMVLAQDWTTVSATNVKGKNHRKLAAGELCFLVTNELGQPTQFKLGGGGRLRTHSFCGLVKNGVVAPFAVPNPEHTQPPVSYRVTIKNSQQKEIFRYTNVRFSGDSFNVDNSAAGTIGSVASVLPTLGAPSQSLLAYSLNGAIFVDNKHYANSAAGLQQAINDAVNTRTYEVHLPCADVPITATVNITQGPLSLIGCSGGDFNGTYTAAITRLKYNGTKGQDVLNIDCAPSRCAGIRLSNLLIDGNGSARYALRQNSQDTTSLLNVKLSGGTVANWYHVNSTGTTVLNSQVTCLQTGGAGLVIDWGSSIFNSYGLAFDTGACEHSTGVLLWIGGGSNRNIKFDGSQLNINTAGPAGFIRIAGYDGSSPWPTSGASMAGAPSDVHFVGTDLLYGAGSPTPASQGADVLISGTAANPPSNIIFDKFKFDARASSGPGQIAVKSDFASNVLLMNGISQGHTAGAGCTLSVTSNTSSPGAGMFNVNSSNVSGTDTNRTCGTVTSITDLTGVLGSLQLSGVTRFQLGSDVFANLGVAADGTVLYCSDCVAANSCAGHGKGAIAKRINGAWVCN
jgi:hypothetical protein